MHPSGEMCSQYFNFLDPCVTVEECVANILIFGPVHYSGGMCSQNFEFLDQCIAAEECVANILISWTHASQWRNV